MHDEELGIALAQFVEAALASDADRTVSYAKHLAKCLRHAGDDETAEQIEALVNGREVAVASPSRRAKEPPQAPVPVDSESRLPLADEHVVRDPVPIILNRECKSVVDRFLDSIRHSRQLQERGVSVPRSIILHGPPGCGKTLLAHHIAHSLSLPVITARADGLVSSYLGSTSKNIRALFEHAANRRCVLFLDEFDAIAKMRDDRHELGELKRVVISLLQNIDAAKDLIFIAATNHKHLLDPAVWRRFSYSLEMPKPDSEAREAMLERFFQLRLPKDATTVLAALTEGTSGAELHRLAEDAMRDAVLRGNKDVDLSDVLRLLFLESTARPEDADSRLTTKDAVKRVRNLHGKAISQTRLAELFGISQSQVSRILQTDD